MVDNVRPTNSSSVPIMLCRQASHKLGRSGPPSKHLPAELCETGDIRSGEGLGDNRILLQFVRTFNNGSPGIQKPLPCHEDCLRGCVFVNGTKQPTERLTQTTGDLPVLTAARAQIREQFRNNASLPPSSPEVEPAIKHAEEVAHFLRTNLVQGKKNEENVYGMSWCRARPTPTTNCPFRVEDTQGHRAGRQ